MSLKEQGRANVYYSQGPHLIWNQDGCGQKDEVIKEQRETKYFPHCWLYYSSFHSTSFGNRFTRFYVMTNSWFLFFFFNVQFVSMQLSYLKSQFCNNILKFHSISQTFLLVYIQKLIQVFHSHLSSSFTIKNCPCLIIY